MASKWKYADTDAQTRLEMLRQGNSELFEEEVARTKSVTQARRELGLDTSEQEKWMDTVGYNYNLSNAENLGESLANVSKTGYADIYLGNGSEGRQKRKKAQESENEYSYSLVDEAVWRVNQALDRAQKSINEKYTGLIDDAENELYDKMSYYREALVNQGASLDGGKAKKLDSIIGQEVEVLKDRYSDELERELAGINKKYESIKDEIYSAVSSGKSQSAALELAKKRIAEMSEVDGYDAKDLINTKNTRKAETETDDSKSVSEELQGKDNSDGISENILKILKMIKGTDEEKNIKEGNAASVSKSEPKTDSVNRNTAVYNDNTSVAKKLKESVSDGISAEDIKLALEYLSLAGKSTAVKKLIKFLEQNSRKITQ